jgi:hypothetical protein
MKTKLTACLFAIAVTSSAQSFDPSIQIQRVREEYASLTASDQKISCVDATGHPDLLIYCGDLRALFLPTGLQVAFASYMVAKQEPSALKSGVLSFLSSAAESRIDSQNGASSNGSGTTSVVERSGISDVLGVALESGGVTQTVSGTNLTLQGNALSLYRFVRGQEVFQYCPQEKANCKGELEAFLNKLSGSATLGLSSASTQTATGTVASSGTTSGTSSQPSASALIQDSASHLTGFSIRFQAINTLDLRSQAYLDAWKKGIADPNLTSLAEQSVKDAAFGFFHPGTEDRQWLSDTLISLRKRVEDQAADKDPKHAKINDDALVSAITEAWDEQIPTWTKNGMSIDALKLFLKDANAYMQARDAAVNKVRQSLASGLTFEYDYARPDNQPRVSTARVIYTLHPGTIASDMPTSTTQSGAKQKTGVVTPQAKPAATTSGAKPKTTNDSAITFNFAADMYDNPPPGTGVLRDLQGALQLDHHFGNTIATLAGYYQYQNQPAALTIGAGNLAPGTTIMLNGTAATLLAPKGNIVVAQAMVTFPLKSGTKLPVGVTWSNRTDLLKGNELRGHVGFNFDWSSLLLGGQAKTANPSQP